MNERTTILYVSSNALLILTYKKTIVVLEPYYYRELNPHVSKLNDLDCGKDTMTRLGSPYICVGQMNC